MTTYALGLDVSKTNTGVAVFYGGNLVLTHGASFSGCRNNSELLDAFAHFTDNLMHTYKPDWIAYEEARPRNLNHMYQHFGMLGILMLKGFRLGVSIVPVHWSTMKKELAGSGKATKEQMLAAANERWPELSIETHDEADAVASGLVVMRQLSESEKLELELAS